MRIRNGLVALWRIALALVFIFSGFVKAVDPWGTAIKLGEYFHAFGMDALSGGRYAFSILLSSAEVRSLTRVFNVAISLSPKAL